MTPDLQALVDRLTTHLAPSTPDRMNYGFPIQLTQAEARMLVDSLAEAERERDRLYAGLSSIVHFQSPLTRSQVREAANELLNNKPVYLGGDQSPLAAVLTEAIASRDTALSELAKAKAAILAKAHEAIGYSDSTAAFLKSIANAFPSPPKDPTHD